MSYRLVRHLDYAPPYRRVRSPLPAVAHLLAWLALLAGIYVLGSLILGMVNDWLSIR